MLTKTLETPVHYNPDLTQIINGEEIMSPSPRANHQVISANLMDIIRAYSKAQNSGKALAAPLDIVFEEGFNRVQPDVMYISAAKFDIIQEWIIGVPDLVIEIVSPSSGTIDKVKKKGIYERYGVPECWLVFPKTQTIEIYSLIENKYEQYQIFGPGDTVHTPTLPGLAFLTDSIFE